MLKSIRQQGITLIELLAVICMIAILVAIGIPSYQNFVLKGRREAARADLIDNVRLLENFYSKNKTFANFNAITQNKSQKFYLITGDYNDNDYQLVASPTSANNGEDQSVVYDSIQGLRLCTKTTQADTNESQLTNCNPF
ncbi:Tfp pilus assembly protein PilE [Snodgrassella alvi SCGC AB-598-O02]|nr:type IV pilin protein [Snodgrassella alvi]KES09355.1 Tfp pilus assembly protein PilE [Snodgrassella alvi SCGC AB-598-O02]